jgi:hypothetical protein
MSSNSDALMLAGFIMTVFSGYLMSREPKDLYVFSWLALPLAFGDNPVLSVPRLPASS